MISSPGRTTAVQDDPAAVDRASHGDTDAVSRRVKADKIAHILADTWLDRLAEARCLDLGCGIGVIAEHLATVAREVVALEPEPSLIFQAPSALSRLQADGLQLPFGDGAFDLVVCAQVYEHVADPVRLASEITRVLRPGGICYFSGPNRLWPYEYHYRAWFIHWLPHRLVKWAVRLLGRDPSSQVKLLSYRQLRRLWTGFDISDYTPNLVRDPEHFPGASAPRWMRRIPAPILAMLAFATPNVNWVLQRLNGDRQV